MLLFVVEEFRGAFAWVGLLAFGAFAAFSAQAAFAFVALFHAGAAAFGFAEFFELGELIGLQNFHQLIFQFLAAAVLAHLFFDLLAQLPELVFVAALSRGHKL